MKMKRYENYREEYDKYTKEYEEKTGRNPKLLITNISHEKFDAYNKVIQQYFKDTIEIKPDAYDVCFSHIKNCNAIVFIEKPDVNILQEFWKRLKEANVIPS